VLLIRIGIGVSVAISVDIHIVLAASAIRLTILQLATTQATLTLHRPAAGATHDLAPAAYSGLNALMQVLIRIVETPSDSAVAQPHLSQLDGRTLANGHHARGPNLELARLLAKTEIFNLLSQMLVLLFAGLELLIKRGNSLVLLPDGASELEFPKLGAVGWWEGHPEGEGGVEVVVYFFFEFLGTGVEGGFHGGGSMVSIEDVVGVGGFGVFHGASDSGVVEGVAEEGS
jgi:hypothetical protein